MSVGSQTPTTTSSAWMAAWSEGVQRRDPLKRRDSGRQVLFQALSKPAASMTMTGQVAERDLPWPVRAAQ